MCMQTKAAQELLTGSYPNSVLPLSLVPERTQQEEQVRCVRNISCLLPPVCPAKTAQSYV